MSDAATAGHSNDFTATTTGIEHKKMVMWAFLASDCMFFGTLISTHLVYRRLYPDGPIDPLTIFNIELTTFSTFILLMSSFLMALAVSAMHKNEIKSFRKNIIGVIFFGVIFLGCQVYEFYEFVHLGKMTISNSMFGTTLFVLTGTHGTHVAIGVLWLFSMLVYSYSGKMTQAHALDIEVAGLYWHFVDIVWLVIFPAVYLVEFVGKTY